MAQRLKPRNHPIQQNLTETTVHPSTTNTALIIDEEAMIHLNALIEACQPAERPKLQILPQHHLPARLQVKVIALARKLVTSRLQ